MSKQGIKFLREAMEYEKIITDFKKEEDHIEQTQKNLREYVSLTNKKRNS